MAEGDKFLCEDHRSNIRRQIWQRIGQKARQSSKNSRKSHGLGGGGFSGLAVPAIIKRYAPTYRLEPKNPINREICENIIKKVVDDSLRDFYYSPKEAQHLSLHISEEIKNRVKLESFDRYRFVCIVTIGEMRMQGYCSVVNFLWDAEKDSFLNYVYDTPDFFAVACLYYVYYD